MKPRVAFSLVTAVVLLALLYTTFDRESDPEKNETTRYYKVALAVAAAFPIAMVGFALSQRIDGFSFGSIVFAVLLEVVIFMGWAASPQEEKDSFFYLASILPLVLIFVTLLFNALQKEA